MRFIEGQHVQDVAVAVALCMGRLRQLQRPVEYPLARAVLRRQAQILNAGTHLVGVAIGGAVMDGELHTASR
ncbi:hypothetical protein D3C86_2021720 [compost metagenome]